MANESTIPLDDTIIHALASASGPTSYLNWKLYLENAPVTGLLEAALYTDTRIIGEYGIGPLKFINTIARNPHGIDLRPAIVLRISYHFPPHRYTPMEETSDEHYHGGDDVDEIAALSSLILGIRLQAGPITREFRLRGDPLGTPTMLSGMKTIPTLYPSHQGPMVPRLSEPVNLTNLGLIEKISKLSPQAAGVVIKSARAYQTALWFADSHAEMSWLFLVSAIESAAGQWAKGNFSDAEPLLPDAVARILREHNCPESVNEALSSYLKKTTKSTRKFVAFLMQFLPGPPTDRPESESLRVDYSSGELEKDFRFIYECRSRALHSGIPFPLPMCSPRLGELKDERNFALGVSAFGSTWSFRKYRPIHFHTFEHIVRGALLQWVNQL